MQVLRCMMTLQVPKAATVYNQDTVRFDRIHNYNHFNKHLFYHCG